MSINIYIYISAGDWISTSGGTIKATRLWPISSYYGQMRPILAKLYIFFATFVLFLPNYLQISPIIFQFVGEF